MSRKIIFRGFNKKNQKWIYGYYFVNRGLHFIVEDGIADPSNTWEDYVVEGETIGQFTGVKDKNGVEIYEGDVMRSDSYPFSYVEKGEYDNYFVEVCWSEESCCFFGYTFKSEKSKVYGISVGDTTECDQFDSRGLYVIGNIHEAKSL